MAAAGFLLVFVALWVRAGWLQIALHAMFEARAQSNWGRRTPGVTLVNRVEAAA